MMHLHICVRPSTLANKTTETKNNPNFHIESTGSANQQEGAFGRRGFLFLRLTFMQSSLSSPQQTFYLFLFFM